MKLEILKYLQDLKQQVVEAEERSKPATKLITNALESLSLNNVVRHPLKAWFIKTLAGKYHKSEKFAAEVELLDGYFSPPWTDPPLSYEFELLDLHDVARQCVLRFVREKGTCDGCSAENQRLTRIDNGQVMCVRCMEGIPKLPHQLQPASRSAIAILRKQGVDIPDGATVLDCWKYKQLLLRRQMNLPDNLSYEDFAQKVFTIGQSQGGKWESFCKANIVGGNYPNSDGTPRLDILRRCQIGEVLKLVREPENPHQQDLRAIKVCRETGEQLGYIPSYLLGDGSGQSYHIADDLDQGVLFSAILRTISAKFDESYAEFKINNGKVIGEALSTYEHQRRPCFDSSTVTARIEVFEFKLPPVQSTMEPACQLKATNKRIAALRKHGVKVAKDASRLECWRQEQALLRIGLGLEENATRDEVVKRVYEVKRLQNGSWENFGPYELVDVNQEVLATSVVGERVHLVREPDHIINDESVKVVRDSGETLGYLSRWENWVIYHSPPKGPETRWLFAEIDNGSPIEAEIIQTKAPPPQPLQPLFSFIEISFTSSRGAALPKSGVKISIRIFILPSERPTA